jgi:hypothetical protein
VNSKEEEALHRYKNSDEIRSERDGKEETNKPSQSQTIHQSGTVALNQVC